jgi:hypothetical protein
MEEEELIKNQNKKLIISIFLNLSYSATYEIHHNLPDYQETSIHLGVSVSSKHSVQQIQVENSSVASLMNFCQS